MVLHRPVFGSVNKLGIYKSSCQFCTTDATADTTQDEEPIEQISVETSMKYLQSKAYEVTYRGKKVWEPYRRNHKGSLPPEKTRQTCKIGGKITTGNPCPICRDKYLVIDPVNTGLLQQFISPRSGDPLPTKTTGVCRLQHRNLLIAIQQAMDQGYIEMPLTHRRYKYEDYYPKKLLENSNIS